VKAVPWDKEFAGDPEFCKLVVRSGDVNLTLAALEVARDRYPDLDAGATLEWIRERGRELAGPLTAARSERDALQILASCLAGEHGLRGSKEAYRHADGSFLHRVIELKRGIPLSLSLIYMAVAEEAGVPLKGVAAPGHFLTRYDAAEGPLFFDAYSAGKVLTLEECLSRVAERAQLSERVARGTLAPANPRTIITRMLHNLKTLYVDHEDWPAAFAVQKRLTALDPAEYHELRDLGLIALRLQSVGLAIDCLTRCLESAPEDEAELIKRQLADARRDLARWN
jgi:regulator of sirC expression with transglutaminase-like and TPR domain